MYEEYFSFAASPFRLNPDPKFFFGSRSHNKAMAYLHYGLRQGEGFIVITGEIGAGKSILIGHLLDQLDRSNVVAAHLVTANLEPAALLAHVLSAFRIEPAGAGKSAEIEAFEDFLFDQMNRGRRVLLIVDEAQNLPVATIEELRMLSNMDYDGTPLFQVFLVGQPEFRAVLAKPEMEQFRQRIIANYHLEPLGPEESTEYIRHRLALVGWAENPTIFDDAFSAIYEATGGVPRRINKLCNRLFLYCSIEKLNAIDSSVVGAVVKDLKAENLERDAEQVDAAPSEPALKTKANKEEQAPAQTTAAAEQNIKGGEQGRPAAIDERKRAVGDHEPRPAPTSNAGRSPVVIPFEPPRKAGSQSLARAKADGADANAVEKPEGAQRQGAMTGSNEPKISAPGASSMSVLDRLRLQRDQPTEASAGAVPAPAPATLKDVAIAIAAAAAGGESAETATEAADEDHFFDAPAAAEKDAAADAAKNWRESAARTIDDAREDLKAAHAAVARLSRDHSQLEKRRREKRGRIAAGLSRAESLLSGLRKPSQ